MMPKTRRVTEWVAETFQHTPLSNLHSYSPELNPNKPLSLTVKSQVREKLVAQDHEELQASLRTALRSNQGRPAAIRTLFQHPSVAYATRKRATFSLPV